MSLPILAHGVERECLVSIQVAAMLAGHWETVEWLAWARLVTQIRETDYERI